MTWRVWFLLVSLSVLWGSSFFFAMGALNNAIPFSLIFWGQTHIAAGLASILNATTPLFTVVVAHLPTHDEKATGAKVAALLSGVVGVAVLIGPAAFVQPSDSP
jgi:drug/metabolite transporter (DMT)-like permease